MHDILPYVLPLGSIVFILFLFWWETARATPPTIPLCLRLNGCRAEDYVEGRVRLYLWHTSWRGHLAQVLLEDGGANTATRQIIHALQRLYPNMITYR